MLTEESNLETIDMRFPARPHSTRYFSGSQMTHRETQMGSEKADPEIR